MIKTKKILSIVVTLMLLFISIQLILNLKSSAIEVSFAISPSKIYDENLDKNEEKSFEFIIANKTKDMPDNNDLIMNIKPKCTIENEDGNEINSKGIIKFSEEMVSLKANESKSIKATVTIPNEFKDGNYKFYIDFVQQPIEGFPLGEQTNVIRVPMYIFVGDKENYKNAQINISFIENYISYGEEKTTILQEIINNSLGILNPLTTYKTYHEIINKPVYTFETKNNGQFFDVNSDIYTKLKNVMTTRESLSDIKYVQYEKEWLNETIKKSVISTTNIAITLNNEEVINITGKSSSLKYVQEQINNIAVKNPNITLNELADILAVPKNRNYEKAYPILNTVVTNNSDIDVTFKGTFETTKNYSEVILNDNISAQTVEVNDTKTIKTLISDKDLSKGTYVINSNYTVRDLSESLTNSFEVKSLRIYVLALTVVINIIYYILIIMIAKKLFKVLKKNK